MRRFIILTFVLFVSLAVFNFSCTKQPVASFEAPASVKVNETFTISNYSDGEYFEWDFGDGETSTDFEPSHEYKKSGTYQITLKAYSKNKKKYDVSTFTVNVEGYLELKNTTFTTVYYEVGGATKKSGYLEPGESVEIDGVSDNITLYAQTYAVYGDNEDVLGEIIEWGGDIYLPDYYYSIDLVLNSEMFYLIIENEGTDYLTNLYVNRFTSNQYHYSDIYVPNDGEVYEGGYYYGAGDETNAFMQLGSDENNWIYGYFEMTDDVNQFFYFYNTYKGNKKISSKKSNLKPIDKELIEKITQMRQNLDERHILYSKSLKRI